jgi:DNA invertase Pin-like site-specific DNA recombinase
MTTGNVVFSMGKVFSYIRFSSAKQSVGDSYARQVRAAKAFCDENDLELADPREYLFFDADRSAFKGKHLDDTGELARFLGFVEAGEYSRLNGCPVSLDHYRSAFMCARRRSKTG